MAIKKLAVDGGTPIRFEPFPKWPELGEQEALAAAEAVRLNLDGSQVAAFEEAFAEVHETRHCVAVNNGTSAIHLVLAALEIGKGDEVLVPTHTYVGSGTPILYQEATPIFVDVEPRSYCIDLKDAERRITHRTRAIIAVHINGHPAELHTLADLSAFHGTHLIEDAAQAHGARYDGQPIGRWGVAACFSFWRGKIITTGGEGGAVLTDDNSLAEKIRHLRDHGIYPRDDGHFHHTVLGYNYRMTPVQAAIGQVQVGRLSEYVQARQRNAHYLSEGLSTIHGVQGATALGLSEPSFWKYVCRLDTAEFAAEITTFIEAVQAEGIPAFRRYPIPLHRQPLFVGQPGYCEQYPVADQLVDELFTLPVHPNLSMQDLDDCVAAVDKVATALRR
jgi:perosamine synthetase